MEASVARSILLDAPMAVLALDRDGGILSANRTAEAFFRGSLAGSAAVSIASLIDGLELAGDADDDAVKAFNIHTRRSAEGVPMQARRLDGTSVPVDVQAARFLVGNEAYVALFIQDATATIAAEMAVQDLRLQITRTWRLNSLGEMASILAHELNQPLSAIANHLHCSQVFLGRDDPDRNAVQRALGSAQAQVQRAGDTIRRLRTMMSRDTGYHKVEHIAEVISEIMPILNIGARELDAELILTVDPGHQTHCDRVQLQQLIVNLVRNAMEAPATGTRRQVRISGQRLNGGAYSIAVEDNGPGIAPQMQEQLFKPLSTTKPDGMGLGLSICRTIVEGHRGTIASCDSALGGAGFVFSLNEASRGKA